MAPTQLLALRFVRSAQPWYTSQDLHCDSLHFVLLALLSQSFQVFNSRNENSCSIAHLLLAPL